MSWWKRRAVAWTFSGVVILASALLGAASSLGGLRDETARVFDAGVSEEEPGIQYDLDWLLELGHNLSVVASRHLPVGDAGIAAVDDARAKLAAAKTPGDKYDAAERLVAVATSLNRALSGLSLVDRDARYNQSIKADIESRWLILGRNPYNERATAFNAELERFPASLLSRIVGVEPLERFAP